MITQITIAFSFVVIYYFLLEQLTLPIFAFTRNFINEHKSKNSAEDQCICLYPILTIDFRINQLINGGDREILN